MMSTYLERHSNEPSPLRGLLAYLGGFLFAVALAVGLAGAAAITLSFWSL
jgi:hypothetical protein